MYAFCSNCNGLIQTCVFHLYLLFVTLTPMKYYITNYYSLINQYQMYNTDYQLLVFLVKQMYVRRNEIIHNYRK